jgi:hypothetical protein
VREQLGLDLEPEKAPRRRRSGVLRSLHLRSHVPGEEAVLGDVRALRQEDRVLEWMKARRGQRFTPWEVAEALGMFVVSVRRAMTNLANALPPRLVHHPEDRRASGPMGSKSSTWEAA